MNSIRKLMTENLGASPMSGGGLWIGTAMSAILHGGVAAAVIGIAVSVFDDSPQEEPAIPVDMIVLEEAPEDENNPPVPESEKQDPALEDVTNKPEPEEPEPAKTVAEPDDKPESAKPVQPENKPAEQLLPAEPVKPQEPEQRAADTAKAEAAPAQKPDDAPQTRTAALLRKARVPTSGTTMPGANAGQQTAPETGSEDNQNRLRVPRELLERAQGRGEGNDTGTGGAREDGAQDGVDDRPPEQTKQFAEATAKAKRRVVPWPPVPYLEHRLKASHAMTIRAVRKMDDRLVREDAPLYGDIPLDSEAAKRSAERYAAGTAKGYTFARYNLGRALAAGFGVKRDMAAAAEQFREAAMEGYVPAMLRLAELYLAGEGVPRDTIRAASWYYLAGAFGSEGGRRGRSMLATQLSIADRARARDIAIDIREDIPTILPEVRAEQQQSLMQAANAGDDGLIERLLKEGVDANAVDDLGRTGLINAAWRGHTQIVKMLAQSGVDVDATDDEGRTALMWSAINGHSKAVDALIDYGPHVDASDSDGLTPLMRAAWNGHTDIVKALIQSKADISHRDKDGKTALERALSAQEREIARMLVEAGAH